MIFFPVSHFYYVLKKYWLITGCKITKTMQYTNSLLQIVREALAQMRPIYVIVQVTREQLHVL